MVDVHFISGVDVISVDRVDAIVDDILFSRLGRFYSVDWVDSIQ